MIAVDMTTHLLDRAAAESLYRVGPLIRASMSEGVGVRAARRAGANRDCLVFD